MTTHIVQVTSTDLQAIGDNLRESGTGRDLTFLLTNQNPKTVKPDKETEAILNQLLPKHPRGAEGMFEASLAEVDVEAWHKECEERDKELARRTFMQP